jgi:hypothetical protein
VGHVVDKNQLLAVISRLVIEMRISDSENFRILAVDRFSVFQFQKTETDGGDGCVHVGL